MCANSSIKQLGRFLSKHLLEGKVRALNLKKPITAPPQSKISEILSILQKHNVGSVAITDPIGELLGIVTERDLLRKVGLDSAAFETLSAGEIMTKSPDTLPAHASVARVLFTMANGHFRHVPVVDSKNTLISVLSSKDVVDFLYKNLAKRVVENTLNAELSDNSATAEFFSAPVKFLSPYEGKKIRTSTTVTETIQRLREEDLGGLIAIGHHQKLAGIFTERDYIKRVALKVEDPDSETIDKFITSEPRTILDYNTCSLAFDLMSGGGFRHLPVVNDAEEVLGVLSVRNFIDTLSKDILEDLTPTQP